MTKNQPADPDTLRLLYEHICGTPREQIRTQEALDGKAQWILGAGGIVLGLSALTSAGDAGAVTLALILAAVALFAALAFLAIDQLEPLKYRVIDDAENVWNSQHEQSVGDAMHALVWDAVEAYQVNDEFNRWKAGRVRLELRILAGEVILVGLASAAAAVGV